ncbi:MAG: hypothetical protein F6K50_02650 [Moorea sp. SIO3I7]|nr:hypothetical protein [Moorena sp. SIO3I7]
MTAQRDRTIKRLNVMVWLMAIVLATTLLQVMTLSSTLDAVPREVMLELKRQS